MAEGLASINEPHPETGDVDGGEEARRRLVVAGGHGAEAPECVEASRDSVVQRVDRSAQRLDAPPLGITHLEPAQARA